MGEQTGSRRMKFGLFGFLIATAIFGAAIGIVARIVLPQPTYVSISSDRQGSCRWESKWRIAKGREELLYIVFFPELATYGINSVNFQGSRPQSKDITCLPEGLFVDGARVNTSSTLQVFVFTQSRRMRPIDLSTEELRQITTENLRRLEKSALWQQKIRPVVQEERWVPSEPR